MKKLHNVEYNKDKEEVTITLKTSNKTYSFLKIDKKDLDELLEELAGIRDFL